MNLLLKWPYWTIWYHMDGTSLGNFCVPDGGLFRVNRFSSSVLLDFMWIVPVWDYSGSWDRYWDMAMEHPAFLEFWRIFRRFPGHISHCLPMFFPKMGFRGWPQNTANKTGFQSMVSTPYDPMEIRLSATSARRRKVDQGYGRDGSNWWLSWNPLWGVDTLDPNLRDCWVTWC